MTTPDKNTSQPLARSTAKKQLGGWMIFLIIVNSIMSLTLVFQAREIGDYTNPIFASLVFFSIVGMPFLLRKRFHVQWRKLYLWSLTWVVGLIVVNCIQSGINTILAYQAKQTEQAAVNTNSRPTATDNTSSDISDTTASSAPAVGLTPKEARRIAQSTYEQLTNGDYSNTLTQAIKLNDFDGYMDRFVVPLAKIQQDWPDVSDPAISKLMQPYESCRAAASSMQGAGNLFQEKPSIDRNEQINAYANRANTFFETCKRALDEHPSKPKVASIPPVDGKLCDTDFMGYGMDHKVGCSLYHSKKIHQIAQGLPYPFNTLGGSLDKVAVQALATISSDTQTVEGTTDEFRSAKFTYNGHPVVVGGSRVEGHWEESIEAVDMDLGPCLESSQSEYEHMLASVGLTKAALRAKGLRVRANTALLPVGFQYIIWHPKKDPYHGNEITIDLGCPAGNSGAGTYRLTVNY